MAQPYSGKQAEGETLAANQRHFKGPGPKRDTREGSEKKGCCFVRLCVKLIAADELDLNCVSALAITATIE